MGFRGAAETMSMDGKRRRDYLPGLSEASARKSHTTPSSQSAVEPASGLHDDSYTLAAELSTAPRLFASGISILPKWRKRTLWPTMPSSFGI